MFKKSKPAHPWQPPTMKSRYDVIIIGAGFHGLCTAYYLARHHGIRQVAVLENKAVVLDHPFPEAAIVRPWYWPEVFLRLSRDALECWPKFLRELDADILGFPYGILDLAHWADDFTAMGAFVSSAGFHGMDAQMVDRQRCGELVPALDIDFSGIPLCGAGFYPSGIVLNKDDLMTAMINEVSQLGVDIHFETEAVGIGLDGHRVSRVDTRTGKVDTPCVLDTTGRHLIEIWQSVSGNGIIPYSNQRLSVFGLNTQPVAPLLDHVISACCHQVEIYQVPEGNLILTVTDNSRSGAEETQPRPIHTLGWLVQTVTGMMPCLKAARIANYWHRWVNVTPDGMPVVDGNHPIQGYYIDDGWGRFQFGSGPLAGQHMAKLIADGTGLDGFSPFSLKRWIQDNGTFIHDG